MSASLSQSSRERCGLTEAADFTPWLRNNVDALADALGIDLELTAIEHQVGPVFLDVIGRDFTNDKRVGRRESADSDRP